MIRMHYVRRPGPHWEWHGGCKRMLADWMVVRRMPRLQVLERQSRCHLEWGCHSRPEAKGRYQVARQWYREPTQLRGLAKALARLAGQMCLEGECRDRVIQEWIALEWIAKL